MDEKNAGASRKSNQISGFLMFLVIVAYISTIIFLVLQLRLPLAISFAVQTVLTLTLFVYMRTASLKRDMDVDVLSINTQYNREQYDKKVSENHELTMSLNKLNLELADKKRDLDNAMTTIDDLKLEIANLSRPVDREDEIDPSSLLPKLSEEERKLTAINIIDAARSVVEELEGAARKCGIQIQIASANEALFVKAAPSRIRILFRNIIDNSIKYMNRAGVLVITISNIGTDIFIVLKDNGKGLEAKETDHIFELNYQGSNRVSGNGLGLAQSKAIVEYYGGTIYAKSNSEQGMGIYIQLPLN